MACNWGGKSTPTTSKTREKLVVAGKSAYSVVVEETSFPASHGTLLKVGGHLIQRTEECEARHKHQIPHTTSQ